MSPVTIDEIEIADDAGRWIALGFEVDGESCAIGGVTLRLGGAREGAGVLGWALREIVSTELDGLPTRISEQAPRPPALPHPNGVVSIDHVVAVSPDLQRSVAALQAAGLDLRRVREEPTPAGAPRQAFFRLGREILEVVQEPEAVIAKHDGTDRPAHFWGLALLVDDLERTVAAMAPHASPPRPAVQPGRRISTLGRSAGLAVPVALMTRQDDAGQGG
jgi:catechol 2,3-dioxygenase-like lactoylglutathione lyase family enzyme